LLEPSISGKLSSLRFTSNSDVRFTAVFPISKFAPQDKKDLFFFFASNQIVNHLRSLPRDTKFGKTKHLLASTLNPNSNVRIQKPSKTGSGQIAPSRTPRSLNTL
jgi:hypothetical protein